MKLISELVESQRNAFIKAHADHDKRKVEVTRRALKMIWPDHDPDWLMRTHGQLIVTTGPNSTETVTVFDVQVLSFHQTSMVNCNRFDHWSTATIQTELTTKVTLIHPQLKGLKL